MPKRKPQRSRKPGPVPRADAPFSDAPEAALRSQREQSSDMQRALPHPACSEETGEHGGRDEPGVPGFLEPRTTDAGARQDPAT
ncbi:MAG: hypothetical protein Q8M77_07205 [Hydrogenophaga sp.]|nr:hypothetical protein [Hydrogenophaga sp.]